VASKPVYSVWLGKDTVDVPYMVTGLAFVSCVFDILYRIYGTFINGMGKLYLQMIITAGVAIVYIPLAVFMGKHFGLSGVLLSNAIVYFTNYLWAKMQCSKLINQTAVGVWDK
jgi:O-antigen/teichoic acid export membrane protein